ncbi:cell envelope integrity EipB family protein [Azospirillum argentinense]|uniref:Cell envelope integrity EipB family protein n=1 Tax=Azospirillum argentinense TaxID=2970906 RepID=A0ABW8V6Q2_9PROT|nr:cell envelope integrity EipB family protein [Azospirillum argentinense]
MQNRRSAARLALCATFGAFLVSLTTLPAAGPVQAAPANAAGAAVGAAAGAAANILPHRAVYKMSLLSARNSSKVSDVRGRMLFEWADACDGWTTEQRFQLRFVYAEGDEMAMTTNYTTWEAKDGQRYRFNVRKLINGEEDEEVRGDARLAKDGTGTAAFSKPEPQDMELPPNTMFPTAHTLAVLDHAGAGETFFNRVVFDGADSEGATEVSTVIGAAAPIKEDGADPLLKGKKAWPVRMAFFPLKSDSAQPEYEMSLRLLQNGVAESMQIDYGDFTVNAILEKVEALPKSGC